MILTVIAWLAMFAFAAGWLARRRDRLVPVWAVYGAILGPVALLLLWAAPHGHCRTCHMPTRGWITTCPWCQENVNTVPSSARRTTRAISPLPEDAVLTLASEPRLPGTTVATQGRRTLVERIEERSSAEASANLGRMGRQSTPTDTGPLAPKPASAPPSARTNLSGTPLPVHLVSERPTAGDATEQLPEATVLATATFVLGTARLEPGVRYGFAIGGSRFQILGPMVVDPERVALDRPIADMNASALEGRLIVNEEKQSGVVLAFMSVAGSGLDELAAAIRAAARGPRA